MKAPTSALGRWIRHRPVSTSLAVLILFLALTEHPIFRTRTTFLWDMGTGYEPVLADGHWWTLITTTFFTNSILALVVSLILTVFLLGAAEKMIGAWRTVIAFLATAAIGSFAGIGLQYLGTGVQEFWSRHVTEAVVLDPTIGIVGAVMAASGSASVLWRRRIRIVTFLVLLVFLLYSGQPDDLYRLLSGVAGLFLGVPLRKQKHLIRWVRSSAHETRVLTAAVVAITAVGPAIAMLSSARFGLLAPIALMVGNQVPDAVPSHHRCDAFAITARCIRELTLQRINSPGAILASMLPLVLLLLAAYGLLHGRRFALWLAVLVNGMFGVLAAFYFGILPISGLPYVIQRPSASSWETSFGLLMSALLPLGIALSLIILRKRFAMLASGAVIRRYLTIITAAALGLAGLYVVGGLLARDTAFTKVVGPADLLGDVVERFIPVSFLERNAYTFLPSTVVGKLLYHGIGLVFWIIVILATLRPLRDSRTTDQPGAIVRVRSLLHSGGGGSLAFMATWPGNSYWFSPEEDVGIAYRVIGRVALTLGGPFGASESTDTAIEEFARFCDDNDWVPVFYSIDAGWGEKFRSMGWYNMVVAEDTVVHPAGWQTTGKKWQDVRTSISRAQRAGVTATWTRFAALPLETSIQITEISEQWVAEKGLPEMGFTLGGLDELRDPSVALLLATDENGRVQAVTSWLPSWRDGVIIGWTLDFMRRAPDSIPGVTEFLIAEAATHMRDTGVEFLSLSGTPLAHTLASPGQASGIERVLSYLSTSLEPVYGFRSLLNFKRKFQPEFRPLLMAYPDQTALPAIGIALARAYMPTLSLKQAANFVTRRGQSAGVEARNGSTTSQ